MPGMTRKIVLERLQGLQGGPWRFRMPERIVDFGVAIRPDPDGTMTQFLSAEEFCALADAGHLIPADIPGLLSRVALAEGDGDAGHDELVALGVCVFQAFDSNEPTTVELEAIRNSLLALAEEYNGSALWTIYYIDAFASGALAVTDPGPAVIQLVLLIADEVGAQADRSGDPTAKVYAANVYRRAHDLAFEEPVAPHLVRECFTRYSDLWDLRADSNIDVTENYGIYLLLSIGQLFDSMTDTDADADAADIAADLATLAERGWSLMDAKPDFSLLGSLHGALVSMLTILSSQDLQQEQLIRLGEIAEHLLADQRFRDHLSSDSALALRIASSILGTAVASSLGYLGVVGDIASTELLERDFDLAQLGTANVRDELLDAVDVLTSLEVARGTLPTEELIQKADDIRLTRVSEIRDVRARVMLRSREILDDTQATLGDRETAATNFARVVALADPAQINVGDVREAIRHLDSVLHIPELPQRVIRDEALVGILGAYAHNASLLRRMTHHADDVELERRALARFDSWVKLHEDDELAESALISLGMLYMLYRADYELFGEDRDRLGAIDTLRRAIHMLPADSPDATIRREQLERLTTFTPE